MPKQASTLPPASLPASPIVSFDQPVDVKLNISLH
jgi:hypothetical protein